MAHPFESILVVAPPDPRLEASCLYARSADYRSLVAETERRMAPPMELELILGVDMGSSKDVSVLTWWNHTTSGRLKSLSPNLSARPRAELPVRGTPSLIRDGLPVDYLNLLGPGAKLQKADGEKMHHAMKELLKKFPAPVMPVLSPPLVSQELSGFTPGDLYTAHDPHTTFQEEEQKLIDKTERKMLGTKEVLGAQNYLNVDYASLETRALAAMSADEAASIFDDLKTQSSKEQFEMLYTGTLHGRDWSKSVIRKIFMSEYMGQFMSPEKKDDEPSAIDNRLRRKKDDADEPR